MKLHFLRLWALLFAMTVPAWAGSPGTVYFALGSDTAVWNWPGGVDIFVHTNHFSSSLYIDPADRAYRVMDPAFRGRFRDSFGTPLKMTWWMLVGSVYGVTDNHDVPVPNLMPLYLMRKYHGDALKALGDELTLHYHTFLWSDYSGAGTFYWNQSKTFHEQRADFDKAIAQSLIEEEVFTVTFRSGWHYMDNEWQSYANQLWPYNMDNDSPNRWAPPVQPFYNVLDWSQAPTDFVPFHPATTNYQVPGDGLGWNVRSVKMPVVSQATVDGIFAAAAAGTNEVVSFWAHLPETDFLDQIARMDQLIHASSTNFPGVSFRYCTAVEAMQRWQGLQDATPPALTVTETTNSAGVTLHLTTDEPIYQPMPFVASKDISENYRILNGVPEGSNAWAFPLPLPKSSLAKLGIAVTDRAGNLTTRQIRYLPDDLFIDNRDSGYSENNGAWTNTGTAAWGVDARIAKLQPGEKVSAQWILPVTEPRPYAVSVQIPAVTNALASPVYLIESGTNTLATIRFARQPPASQWIYLATVFLDPAQTNLARLTSSGSPWVESTAVADVVKVSPLVQPHDFIRSVQIDPGETTANLIWSTAAPATAVVEYGEDLRYGHLSTTNLALSTNHVATLTGLTPGVLYQYQILSGSAGYWYTAQGQFQPRALVDAPLTNENQVFKLTQQWLYNTNNLDGVPWQFLDYDDSLWPAGNGLLWVDTQVGGLGSDIQPKGTEMPFNRATKYPFTTYYFRTHFILTNSFPIRSLVLTNFIDDGAVFSLDGVEFFRNNLPAAPTLITNAMLAVAANCAGNATCPIVFRMGPSEATNILAGPHVLAVEVHNYSDKSPDITFGSALSYFETLNPAPVLKTLRSEDSITLYWNGEGYTLQQSDGLDQGSAGWTDVTSAQGGSPWRISGGKTQFFRLRE